MLKLTIKTPKRRQRRLALDYFRKKVSLQMLVMIRKNTSHIAQCIQGYL